MLHLQVLDQLKKVGYRRNGLPNRIGEYPKEEVDVLEEALFTLDRDTHPDRQDSGLGHLPEHLRGKSSK